MEEKILEKLEKLDKIDEKLEQLDKIDEKLEQLEQRMDEKIDNLRIELNQNMNDLRKEILDRQFVFEEEYGKKIDAIFDYVQFHQDKNLKRFNQISDLEKRVETVKMYNLDHEKRISALERKRI